uniref:NTF2 domain-containing protein n=1 Tax=Oryza brachyantha TaxID=4533 RepID=J3MUQ6_ORYBR
MDADAVAKAFVEHYYRTFDTNRPALVSLYQDGSMLTFEGQQFLGPAAIAGKLSSLPFAQCHHDINTVDCQPSGPSGGMLVFVSGSLRTGPEFDGSMLTFEGQQFLGPAAIAGKLSSLPFAQCHHDINTVDCQPSGPSGGMLVFVSGSLRTGPEDHPLKFSQRPEMFQLLQGGGNFYVQNDMFRLNYG